MQKECVYVIMLKIALVLVKNVFFGLKKGISELLHWVAPKHTAHYFEQNTSSGCVWLSTRICTDLILNCQTYWSKSIAYIKTMKTLILNKG